MPSYAGNNKKRNYNLGDFNKYISIGIEKDVIIGGLPQEKEYEEIYKVWSAVNGITMSKEEFITAQGVSVGECKEFTIRYKEGITNKNVIKYKNKTYYVYSVYPLDENDEFLLITAIIYR